MSVIALSRLPSLPFSRLAALDRPARGSRLALPRPSLRPDWQTLSNEAVQPNCFLDPGVTLAAADGPSAPRVLLSYAGDRLVGVAPVVSAWDMTRLPIPTLFIHQPYLELSTPLLHRDDPVAAAAGLLDAAAAAGQRLIVLPQAHLDGEAFKALAGAAAMRGATPVFGASIVRAVFDATQDVDAALRASLGAKKLKELRRQSHRLEDDGPVRFEVATEPRAAVAAFERFLALEAEGWKGTRGTALLQNPNDSRFVRAMARDLAERGRLVVAELRQNERSLAAGAVLLQQDEAVFFKIAYDETMARCSPGVQLTLELTRWLGAQPGVARIDSTAVADHSMIDHIWRERRSIGLVYLPLYRNDPLAAGMIAALQARAAARARLKGVYLSIKGLWEKKS